MNPGIFREYDIRGVAGKDMDESDVFSIGKAVGTYLKRRSKKELCVGRDCRISSDPYSRRIIEGLKTSGCNVTDIGIVPTPVFYFSIHHLQKDGGVMVTASHNPKEYNGFKLCIDLDSIHGEEIQEIRKMIENEDMEKGHGLEDSAKVVKPYIDFLVKDIDIPTSLKVGIDAGNGTAGLVALPAMERLGLFVNHLYCEMDGNFPNHEADPTVKKNMEDLIRLVQHNALDVGIGFDGDGDRIGVVDENGELIYGDKLLVIFAREILQRKPGATFISEVKCSKTLYDDIEQHGGRAIMWKTGHSLIKKKMKEEQAALAGEMSGHMFFQDRYLGYDDALYAALRLLEIMSKTGKKVSELISDLPKTYNTPEIRVDCPDEIKFQVVEKVAEKFRQGYDVIDIDGVRVRFDDGWGLVRASNTQPALVLRFEALTEDRLKEIRNLVETALEKAKKEVAA